MEHLEKGEENIEHHLLDEADIKRLTQEMQSEIFREEKVLDALVALVEHLGDKLDAYDVILSDDASGRLPSLFLRKVINAARAKEGKEPVETYFLSGGIHWRGSMRTVNPEVKRFLDEKNIDGKVLLVTEYIMTGESIERIVHVLEHLGVDYDIASVSIEESPDTYSFKDKLVYGRESSVGLMLWSKNIIRNLPQHIGVEKQDKAYVLPQEQYQYHAHPRRSPHADMEKMKEARNDINTLANALIEKKENPQERVRQGAGRA